MKLKTLKDFFPCELECKYEHHIKISELKQEAIKWIKECKCQNIMGDKHICEKCKSFEKFFNITEEDLK